MGFLDILKTTPVSNSVQVKADEILTPEQIISVQEQNADSQKNNPLFKAVIPEFLYKPPFGFPRNINVPFYRSIAKNGYIGAVIKLLQDQVSSQPWDIVPIEGLNELTPEQEMQRMRIKEFIDNPNDDDESFSQILKKTMNDFAVLDSPCWVKIFNPLGELIQYRYVDGGSMTKNPDGFGRIGDRADIVVYEPTIVFRDIPITEGRTPKQMQEPRRLNRNLTEKEILNVAQGNYNSAYGTNAAYFQYSNNLSVFFPIPFGKKEIIFMMQNPAPDSVYSFGSPLMMAVDMALTLIYGSKFNTDFFLNGNTPEGIIQLAGATNEQINALSVRLKESMYSYDSNTGLSRRIGYRMPVTNATDAKFVPLNFSSKEMEIIEQQKWFTKVLWSNFGVTPDELGFTEDSSRHTSQDQMKAAARKAIKPYLKTIEFYINSQLLKDLDGGKYFKFKFDEYDIDEEIKKRTLQEQEIRMGLNTWQKIADEEGINVKMLEQHKNDDIERQQKMAGTQDFSNTDFNKNAPKDEPKKVEGKSESREESTALDDVIEDIVKDIEKVGQKLNKK